jgi:predicted nucleic acid-binding protein
MKLVVDANILFSFFKRDSTARNLLTSFELFELYTPALGFSELVKNKAEICRKAAISEAEFEDALEALRLFIGILPDEEFKEFGSEAQRLLGAHTKDVPYFALALYLNCGIWSNEKRFKEQSRSRVFSTTDLVELLRIVKS